MKSKYSADSQSDGAKWQVARSAVVLGGLVLLVAGCESYPESHVVSAPPPSGPAIVATSQPGQGVVVAPGQNPNAPLIIAQQAPPTVQTEVVTAQPSSDHKWIPGYWTWRNERYEWMAGRWALPPSRGETWVAPRWERLSDGTYRFYEGYWN